MASSAGVSVLTDCEFLFRAIRGIVWEADPKTVKFTFVSDQATGYLVIRPRTGWPTIFGGAYPPGRSRERRRHVFTCGGKGNGPRI
jgi:hypothetical protein